MSNALKQAARKVIDNWSQGNLAAAVRELETALNECPDQSPEPTIIYVIVEGGVVQDVVSRDNHKLKNVVVQVIDYDVDGVEDELITRVKSSSGHTQGAIVGELWEIQPTTLIVLSNDAEAS